MGPQQFHDVAPGFSQTELSGACGHPADKAFGKLLTRPRCEDDRETFHFTDHYRNDPVALARLKRLDAKTLRGYLERQWRHNAPRKWLKAW
jgi:hypothetical protein